MYTFLLRQGVVLETTGSWFFVARYEDEFALLPTIGCGLKDYSRVLLRSCL
jgi:hypothetical protein